MDNSPQPVYTAPQQQAPQPSSPAKRAPVLIWLVLIVLIGASIAGFGLYLMSQKQLKEAQQSNASLQQSLSAKDKDLKKANDALKTAVQLPIGRYSPQCYAGDNAQTRLAPVNRTPIDGYNVYIVNCINDLLAGKNNNKVIAFSVDTDGKQTFQYGAASGEPYCVSAKILPAAAANDIHKQTGLPVCTSY